MPASYHLSLRHRRWLLLLVVLLSLSGLFASRPVFAASTPIVSLNVPPAPLIGETLSFTATFDNTGTTPGYGPYVDLVLPAAGIDGNDGL
ncbi:MAG: hypothetical protein MUD01_10700, partial [Chloroflexaceae bacterium]|nr:hypothetical protein [Chloroflexaceae bacterium]